MTREQRLLTAVLDAVGTLVDDYDLIDFLHALCDRCTELLGVSGAGVMLADRGGRLHLIAASDEHARLTHLFDRQFDEGPAVDAYREGRDRLGLRLGSPAVAAAHPLLAADARRAGFAVTHALPLRLRDRAVGALSLFDARDQDIAPDDARAARALADVTTLAVLQQRSLLHGNRESAQLQAALAGRVVIEQAKGVLAEHWHVGVDEAFDGLRAYARSRRLGLSAVCRQLVERKIDAADLQRLN
ncbi:GAF and ANTAR domain-containing protein [Streptomyces sp. CRN 30]|uniref:GAF and ANTAR domain-containing protein n=1 Tax=Streptomyces sp. CRN 30 TaxID=3075613 RepID=UPI002A835757|nr:GAF and ANTAR domain-containing protein [Streptomyces sp. CRN 30]